MSGKITTYHHQENPWFLIAVAILGGLLFLPPYFRGLFFPKEQLVAFIAALWAFFAVWMYKAGRKDFTFFRNPVDYFALALVVCYFIAIFGAANFRLAVQGFVKIFLFFLVYWVAGELSKKEPWEKILAGILYATGVGVALAGLGAALGVVEINNGFVGTRIFSTLQYPNSLAVYLLAISFIGFYFWSAWEKRTQFLFAAGNYFILMAFLGTSSRGGLLVALLMVPVFLLGLPGRRRVWVIFHLLFTGGGVLVGSWRFIPSIMAQEPGKAWLFLGLGLAVALAGQGILLFSRQYLGDRKTVLTLAGLIVVVLVTGAVYLIRQEVTINQITNPNDFSPYADAVATMARLEDGWNRVDVFRVGNNRLVGRTGGYSVKPGETVTYTIEFKSSSGQWVPWLAGSRPIGPFEQVDDTTWTVTWTNEDEVNSGEYVYFRHISDANKDLEDIFYFRNPVAVVEGQTVTFWQKVLPKQFWERMQTINVDTILSQDRLFWSAEAIELIKQRPIFGYGGGGWEAVYRSIQSYDYSSTQVHNDWLQLGVETGIPGLLVWLGLWVTCLYGGIQAYRQKGEAQRAFTWAIMAGTVAIGGHALIDFDLSLGAVSIALWFGFGVIAASWPGTTKQKDLSTFRERKRRFSVYHYRATLVVGIVCILFTLGACSLIAGYNYGVRATKAVKMGDGTAGIEYYEKASFYDPFQGSYDIILARLYSLKGEHSLAISRAEKAIKKAPYDWEMYLHLADIYWQEEQLDNCIQMAEAALNCAPLAQSVNIDVARIYAMVGIRYLEKGNMAAAANVFHKVISMPESLKTYFIQLPEKVQLLWSKANRWKVDEELALSVGIAHYCTGNFQQAEEYLELAVKDEAFQAEALVWLAAVKQKLGQQAEARKLFDQASEMDETMAKNYYAITAFPVGTN